MLSFDPATLKDRREAEAILQREGVDDWALRKFLLSNMDRAEGGGFRWKINLHAIHDSLPAIFGPVLGEADRYDGSVLLIRGGDSRFVPDEDFPVLRAHFPALRLITIHEAGHNVHADAPEAFLKAVLGAQD
jgi:esterase